jgi:hypothetical protein
MPCLKMPALLFLILISFSCQKPEKQDPSGAYRLTRNIEWNGISVDVVIDKPAGNNFDVLVVYHGTVYYDSLILDAANKALDAFKRILDRTDIMMVSVAYPEEELLMGDNVAESEAALLWVQNAAAGELDITIKKVLIAGHSQGGYIVTRLNTLHETDGVIANGPGPLNLIYRCELEETGKIAKGMVCTLLNDSYGTTTTNPDAYFQRSLLNFTSGFKSDILFVQGLQDSFIQMYSWPLFKAQVEECADCVECQFLELEGYGHQALFQSQVARTTFNAFINR